jgi:5'-nucleotidase
MHHGEKHNFDVATKVLRRVANKVLEHGLPEGVDVLNLNVPADATEDTEIVVTRLARKIFKTTVQERFDPRGRPYYWIDGDRSPVMRRHRCADSLPGPQDLSGRSRWTRRPD